MAKAKSASTKVVKKQSIVDAAKEAYLKKHTKEQMYLEYDKLHIRYQQTNDQLESDKMYIRDLKDRYEKKNIAFLDLCDENSRLEHELYWCKKSITVLRIGIAMLCAGLLLIMFIK